MVAELFLFVPLIADVTLVLWSVSSGDRFTLIDFVRRVISIYPFALIPFGFIPPVLGIFGWWLANRIVQKTNLTKRTQFALATIVGAVAGLLVMSIFDAADQAPRPGHYPDVKAALLGFGIVGLVTGAASGLIVARHLGPQRSILQPSPSEVLDGP
jgi:hypothetical protein